MSTKYETPREADAIFCNSHCQLRLIPILASGKSVDFACFHDFLLALAPASIKMRSLVIGGILLVSFVLSANQVAGMPQPQDEPMEPMPVRDPTVFL